MALTVEIGSFDDMCEVLHASDLSHGNHTAGMLRVRYVVHVLVEATGRPCERDRCIDLGALFIECAVRIRNQHTYDDFDFDDLYAQCFATLKPEEIAACTAALAERDHPALMSGVVRPLNKVVLEWENGVIGGHHRTQLYQAWATLLRYGMLLVARGIDQVPTREQVFAAFSTRLPKT